MKKYCGFSLLEMLMALIIVVSIVYTAFAITSKTDKKTKTESILKNVYTTIGQITREQNYKKPIDTWGWDNSNIQYASESILNNYILPSIKKKITCSNPLNCVGGFMSKDGEEYTNYRHESNYARAIVGKDGVHIALKAIGKCKRDDFSSLCGIAIIDIDNKNGNNKLGDDVFIFGIYGAGNFMPFKHNISKNDIKSGCTKDSFGDTCAARIMNNNWKIDYWE